MSKPSNWTESARRQKGLDVRFFGFLVVICPFEVEIDRYSNCTPFMSQDQQIPRCGGVWWGYDGGRGSIERHSIGTAEVKRVLVLLSQVGLYDMH